MLSTSARTCLAMSWLGLMFLPDSAIAQPVLNSLLPLSAAPGSQVTVELSGKDLQGASRLWFSLAGVTATAAGDGRFVVTVAPDVVPQTCDVWCEVDGRLSNPRRFVVTTLPGRRETDENSSAETSLLLTVPGAVDARLESRARTDWFHFDGRVGQSLTLRCRSRSLDGDVLPVVTLFAPGGAEVAHSSGRRREPVVNVVLPTDGTYHIRVNDRAYRQSTNSVYRLELLTGPRFLTVFPDLLSLDKSTLVTAYGLELSDDESTSLALAGDGSRLQSRSMEIPISTHSASGWSAATEAFALTDLNALSQTQAITSVRRTRGTVIVEDEPHTRSITDAQRLAVPTLLNGRFADRGDVDWFAFDATKGQTLNIDVYGDRFGHEMDLDAAILDEQGKVLVTLPDLGSPKGLPPELTGTSLDVSANWKPPADGTYRLVVRDLYSSSVYGADRTYALHLRRAAPRAQVVVLPPAAATKQSSYVIPRSGYAALRVTALRLDGMDAPIQLRLPSGESSLSGIGLLRSGQAESWLMIGCADQVPSDVQFVDVEAEVQSADPEQTAAVRICTAADNAGVPGRFVDQLPVIVGPSQPLGLELRTSGTTVTAGSDLQLTIQRTRLNGKLKAAATIEFLGLPDGVKAPAVKLESEAGELTTAIPVPAKQAAGTSVIAVKVKAIVVVPEAPGSKKASTKDVPVEVISNPLTVTIKPASDE